VKLTTDLYLVLRSKKAWSYISAPQYAFMAWCSVKAQGHLYLFYLYGNRKVTIFDRYDILYAGNRSDASVGSGRRRLFVDWCGFRFSITLWNVFVIELSDSVMFSVVQTVISKFDLYYACGSLRTYSHLNYMKTSCVTLSEFEFCKVWVSWG
jgi:hypothetical protein